MAVDLYDEALEIAPDVVDDLQTLRTALQGHTSVAYEHETGSRMLDHYIRVYGPGCTSAPSTYNDCHGNVNGPLEAVARIGCALQRGWSA